MKIVKIRIGIGEIGVVRYVVIRVRQSQVLNAIIEFPAERTVCLVIFTVVVPDDIVSNIYSAIISANAVVLVVDYCVVANIQSGT